MKRGRSGRSASSGQFLSSGSIWSVGKFWGSPWRIRVSDGPGERAQRKGRVALPNQMNFRKNSKRPSTPLPHFRKIMLHIAHDRYGCIYARRYDGQIVRNACTWFPEIGTILRGGGQLRFGTFLKIHSAPFLTSSISLVRPAQMSWMTLNMQIP